MTTQSPSLCKPSPESLPHTRHNADRLSQPLRDLGIDEHHPIEDEPPSLPILFPQSSLTTYLSSSLLSRSLLSASPNEENTCLTVKGKGPIRKHTGLNPWEEFMCTKTKTIVLPSSSPPFLPLPPYLSIYLFYLWLGWMNGWTDGRTGEDQSQAHGKKKGQPKPATYWGFWSALSP